MNHAQSRNLVNTPDEAEIAAYLEKNPDFLDRHPDVLETINAHHHSGRAVSLIERQVEALRSTNRQLQQRYSQLVNTARDNEQRVVQLNRLAQVFVAAGSVSDLLRDLAGPLRSELDVDDIFIGVDTDESLPDGVHALQPQSETSRALTNVFRRGKPICGPLSQSQSQALFGADRDSEHALLSGAMIPLGKRGTHGALVLASTQDNRFVPEMGILFLELTGQLATTALRRLLGTSVLP